MVYDESFPDEHLFLIYSQDPWYGDLIFYVGLRGPDPGSVCKV